MLFISILSGCNVNNKEGKQEISNVQFNDIEADMEDFLKENPELRGEIMDEVAKRVKTDKLTYKGISEKADMYYDVKDGKVYASKKPLLEYKLTSEPSNVIAISDNHVRKTDSFEIYQLKYKDLISIQGKYLEEKSVHSMKAVLNQYTIWQLTYAVLVNLVNFNRIYMYELI